MSKIKKFPPEIIVYVCDQLEDGTPVYAVAQNVNQIPEDVDGKAVGVYALNRQWGFQIRRELK